MKSNKRKGRAKSAGSAIEDKESWETKPTHKHYLI